MLKKPRVSLEYVILHELVHLDMYVRLYDDQRRGPGCNPTVGNIVCANKDETVVRYPVLHDNEKLFASKYKLVLPSETEPRTVVSISPFARAIQ